MALYTVLVETVYVYPTPVGLQVKSGDQAEKEMLKHSSGIVIDVVQSLSCAQLCDSMDCSMPAFPLFHNLPEFTQTHVL